MIFQDDRTEEQRKTHPVVILGTDSFMSGWGKASGGPSYAGWACSPDDMYQVERWIRNRGDMKRVRFVARDYRPPSGDGHCHIYVVGENHPSLGRRVD